MKEEIMSNRSPKIAVIGHGFVGQAVSYGFHALEQVIIDPGSGTKVEDLLNENIGYAFVAVPTPMGENGVIDSSIIEYVVTWLKETLPSTVIVIKSTVTPDILTKLAKGTDKIVYNPEFLTEKNANQDFITPFMHILGGEYIYTTAVESLYINHSACKPAPAYHMTIQEASFVKYGMNSFLATKVLWFNQFYDIVTKNGANFNKVINAIGTDPRIGRSHITVPGFDNKRGYGGACFPKDTAALVRFAGGFSVLEEVIKANNDYRSVYQKDERELAQNVNYDIKV